MQTTKQVLQDLGFKFSVCGTYLITSLDGITLEKLGEIEKAFIRNFLSPIDVKKHKHYFKDVRFLRYIDVYRVIELFGVKRAPVQHALKKVLCAGDRGGKDYARDIKEAIDSLQRELDMLAEESKVEEFTAEPVPVKPIQHQQV